jgi:uncharacterized protein (DUF433 family)
MSSVPKKEHMLGKGVYSLPEAAHLLGLAPRKLRTWFVGRGDQKPFFFADHPRVGSDIAISFRDLIDAYVASQFRDRGLSLQSLRRIFANLQSKFGDKHGFCHETLKTDGHSVFLHAVDEEGKEKLVDLLDNQLILTKVLLPFLSQLEFDPGTKLAYRWNVGEGIVVDPSINFGKPVVVGSFVSAEILAGAFEGNNRNAANVAAWFNVSEAQVLDAVRFLKGLQADHSSLRRAA